MIKRLFDIFFALLALIMLGGILLICIIISSIETKSFGLFIQNRIGQHGVPFKIFKIKTLSDSSKSITPFGRFLRASKLNELPQLVNVLLGNMSFVGPRPDISGYADLLEGDDLQVLSIRPGITGLASLKYRNEEALLSQQPDPQVYNDTVIWPDKVRINKWYLENRSFSVDLKIIFHTLFTMHFDVDQYIANRSR